MKPTREMTASNAPGSHVQLLAVEHSGLDVAQPGFARAALGEGEDVAGDVGGQHMTVGPDAPGRRERLAPGAGCHVEHPRRRATPAMSSIASVASPSQASSVGPQRCQGSAAVCHWSVVVRL